MNTLQIVFFCGFLLPVFAWTPVFVDEFDNPGLPDESKWQYEEGYRRNNEAQAYCASRLENACVESGMLVITTLKEDTTIESRRGTTTYHYTSASLHTRNTATWTYGKFEIRVKIPRGIGIWPALWLYNTGGGGEMDIMENVGFELNRLVFTAHTESASAANGNPIQTYTEAFPDPWDNFYTFTFTWTPQRLDWYVDDVHIFEYVNPNTGFSTWPFDEPFYLIMNTAVGGNWGGREGIDDSIFPQQFFIDYVRVYKADGSEAPLAAPNTSTRIISSSNTPATVMSYDLLGRILSTSGNSERNGQQLRYFRPEIRGNSRAAAVIVPAR